MLMILFLYTLMFFLMYYFFFFFKQKTAYEMRISDWSSDVCSSDLAGAKVVREVVTGFTDIDKPAIVPLLEDGVFGLSQPTVPGLEGEISGGEHQHRLDHGSSPSPCSSHTRRSRRLMPSEDRNRVEKGQMVTVSVHIGRCRFTKKKT